MEISVRENVAVIQGAENLFADPQSALDLMMDIQYHHNVRCIALPLACVSPDFFRLATGCAGEVLQKFVNYHMQLAVFGDFSVYQSPPLQAFIRESNRGRHAFFVATEDEAIEKLRQ
jgi:hypothetical protein